MPPSDRLRGLLRSHYLELSAAPHPTARRAAQGETLADYAGWCLANGGTDCRLRVITLIERALAVPSV